MANTVIQLFGQYDLEPDYATVWRASTENGIESIFELQGRAKLFHMVYNNIFNARRSRTRRVWMGF